MSASQYVDFEKIFEWNETIELNPKILTTDGMQGGVEEGLLGPGEDGEAATVLPAGAEQQDLLATWQHAQEIININIH